MSDLHEVRHADENQPADQGDQHDRPGNGAAWIAGFFGQGADRVEAQERVTGDGRAAHDQRHLHVAIEERLDRPQWRACITADVMHAQRDEGDQHQELHQHQQGIDAVGQLQADDVDRAGDADERQYPDPLRHRRECGVEVGRADQPDRHGQEQVIEQHRPTGDEPEFRADGLAHIAVGRAGHRERRSHPPIAHGSEEHRHQRREVRGRHHAGGGLSEDAKGAEHNDRRHVGDAKQHHRA
ncbi:hypothetical protein D3C80_1139770 [compost metagenome]